MNKPLFFGLSGLTLIALTATTLYAQSTTASTLIAKMKAAAANFTLTELIPSGQTGLTSAPLVAKKTGDILTAGEYNRILEVIASLGGGISDVELITSQAASPAATADYSFRVSQANCPTGKKVISGGCSYPNTLNTFVHNTPTPDLNGWICGGLHHDGDTTNNTTKYPYRPTAYAICGTYGNGGSGTGGSGWVDVSLTDTADFDTSCLYRFQTGANGYPSLFGNSPYYIVNVVSSTQLTWWLDMGGSDIRHISSSSKNKYRINGVEYAPSGGITKMEKFCGGGGSSSGVLALYKCTNAQSLDVNNAPCYGAARNGGAGTDRYRVVSCSNTDASGTYTAGGLLNFGTFITNKWSFHINNSNIACTDGTVLVMDIQGGISAGSVSGSWSDISLTDATPFDVNCEYRFKASAPGNTTDDAFIGDDNAYNYIQRVNAGILTYQHTGTFYEHINADTKTTLRWNGTPTVPLQTITQIQKRCN